ILARDKVAVPLLNIRSLGMNMAENLLIEKCSAEITQDVKAYWEKKVARVERLLHRFPADQRTLSFHFDCASYGYEARAVPTLRTGPLAARTEAPVRDPRGAVDHVADRLAEE